MNARKTWGFLFLGMLSACATTSGVSVVERADGLSSTPEWASFTNSVKEDHGKFFFLGYVEVSGDASKSAALNMSDEKAMSEPMRALTDQFLDQNQVGEELRKDNSVGTRIISATRGYRPPMADLKIVKRYWETVRVPNQDDPSETRVELRAYSLAQISKADYESAKREYLARLRGTPAVKKILEDVGAKQREEVLSH
jgi:hypothetical protein